MVVIETKKIHTRTDCNDAAVPPMSSRPCVSPPVGARNSVDVCLVRAAAAVKVEQALLKPEIVCPAGGAVDALCTSGTAHSYAIRGRIRSTEYK